MKKVKDTNPLSAKNITFFTACRENTGAHMCDSGGAYGRIYDRPADDKDTPAIKEWDKGCSATICTAAFLDEYYTIDRKLQAKWEKWDAKGAARCDESGLPKLSWFESGAKFCEDVLLLFREHRDNVCNSENDFDQVFVYEAYNRNQKADWIYPEDDTLVVLYLHTGCDVRGGYGRPVFCRVKSRDNYTVPMDRCAGYYAYYCDPTAGDDRVEESENWCCGYSSWPYGQLEKDVQEWHEDTRTHDSVEVTLNSGERVKVTAYAETGC